MILHTSRHEAGQQTAQGEYSGPSHAHIRSENVWGCLGHVQVASPSSELQTHEDLRLQHLPSGGEDRCIYSNHQEDKCQTAGMLSAGGGTNDRYTVQCHLESGT
jgi:hypothetical protein